MRRRRPSPTGADATRQLHHQQGRDLRQAASAIGLSGSSPQRGGREAAAWTRLVAVGSSPQRGGRPPSAAGAENSVGSSPQRGGKDEQDMGTGLDAGFISATRGEGEHQYHLGR